MKMAELKERYEKDSRWREAWLALANKHNPRSPRLQVQQEYIEYRSILANGRIGELMLSFDKICSGQTTNP